MQRSSWLHMLLAVALVGQLTIHYRCCASADLCRLMKCVSQDGEGCCAIEFVKPEKSRNATSCCGGHDHHSPASTGDESDETVEQHDERSGSAKTKCCHDNKSPTREPIDGIPAKEIPQINLITVLAIAAPFEQTLFERIVKLLRTSQPIVPRPAPARLAVTCVWRN